MEVRHGHCRVGWPTRSLFADRKKKLRSLSGPEPFLNLKADCLAIVSFASPASVWGSPKVAIAILNKTVTYVYVGTLKLQRRPPQRLQ